MSSPASGTDADDSGNPNTTVPSAGTKRDNGGSALTEAVRVAIPLGIALVVGVFVALGIQGEVFARLIRDSPDAVAMALLLAVVGVVAPLIIGLIGLKKAGLWGGIAGACLLGLATWLAISAGTSGIAAREQPDITLTLQGVDAKGRATVTIKSTGLSLRSGDHLLLRIMAFPPTAKPAEAFGACRDTAGAHVVIPPLEGSLANARLVYWGEGGPTATGTVEAEIPVTVDRSKVAYICGLAILSGRVGDSADPPRFSTVLFDVGHMSESAPK